jgi:predicted Zn-dependent protease
MDHKLQQPTVRENCIRSSFVMLLLAVAAVFAWGGCRTTPVTGRRQLLLIPESREISMGVTAYQGIMEEETPTSNQRWQEMVKRVGQRIAAVSGRDDFQWEFKVVKSPEQNAFCLPGGKVAVYEGILPICENEAGLAVVMSHEIAHALARHGGERMSHSQVKDVGKNVVSAFFKDDEKKQELVLTAYGLGSQYGLILPYSRKHESEADQIGMTLMAKAGYDPSEAPRFWQRFGQAKGASSTSEFFSTHPSDERRAAELQTLLPEAKAIYERAATKIGLGEEI